MQIYNTEYCRAISPGRIGGSSSVNLKMPYSCSWVRRARNSKARSQDVTSRSSYRIVAMECFVPMGVGVIIWQAVSHHECGATGSNCRKVPSPAPAKLQLFHTVLKARSSNVIHLGMIHALCKMANGYKSEDKLSARERRPSSYLIRSRANRQNEHGLQLSASSQDAKRVCSGHIRFVRYKSNFTV